MTIFSIEKLTKTFKTGDIEEEVLKGIDLHLQEGELTILVGTSGSGKSTLLTIAACLQRATSGQITFAQQDLTSLPAETVRKIRARQFGFVFQYSHLVPFLTVEEQLMLMLDVAESNLSKNERKQTVENLLNNVGMLHRKTAYPASLSGGERQRVAVARAIIHEPKLLFADEPTASLDSSRSQQIMSLIRDLTKSLKITTLMVTHDEELLTYADRVIGMRDGLIHQIKNN